MEDLSKQQLILLALLVSFVTSLMTGIVTVSLMDQAPQNVARVITQVVRETVSGTVPPNASSTAAVVIAVSDQVAEATAAITPSIVRLKDGSTGRVAGLGLIVSSSGVIMTDKSLVDELYSPEAILPDGRTTSVAVVRFQIKGDVAFVAPTQGLSLKLKPIAIAAPARLGETVWSLSGASNYTLSQGIVTEVNSAGTADQVIQTTIPANKTISGSPLFDAAGRVIGIQTGSLAGKEGATFYPVELVRGAIPE